MDYKKVYEQIVDKRRACPAPDGKESHHVLPKSLGGTDNPENLVDLTFREHYICHRLLFKMYPEGSAEYYKMAHAWMMMFVGKKRAFRFTSKTYALAKAAKAEAQSVGQSGQGNSQYGTVWIFHPDFGARKVRSELMVAYLDQGWYKGKVLKACSPDKRFGRRITDERLEELRRWHSLYVEIRI